MPLGTRGGRLVRHVFPADGEYKLFGRLVRGIEEGYAGVEGNDLPHTFVITVDGAEVHSAEIGGLEDHKAQAKDMNEARAIIDARMTARVTVTAGPHDIGFTFRERPGQQQDVWQPALRDSQEIHMIGGLPKLKTVGVEGPYNVTGVSATPSRERMFVCRPAAGATRGRADDLCDADSLDPRASAPFGVRSPLTISTRRCRSTATRAAGGDSFDAGIRAGLARILASPNFLYRIERDAPGVQAGRRASRSATSSSRRVCRSSCGAASPTSGC